MIWDQWGSSHSGPVMTLVTPPFYLPRAHICPAISPTAPTTTVNPSKATQAKSGSRSNNSHTTPRPIRRGHPISSESKVLSGLSRFRQSLHRESTFYDMKSWGYMLQIRGWGHSFTPAAHRSRSRRVALHSFPKESRCQGHMIQVTRRG